MFGQAEEGGSFAVADAPVDGAGVFGCFGGVLGDVGGHSLLGDLGAVSECLDRPYVELSAPAQLPAVEVSSVRGGRDGHGDVRVCGSGLDRVGEQFSACPRWRRGVGPVGSVDADHSVEVDCTALLELRDLAVGEAGGFLECLLGDADSGGEFAA